MLKTGSSRSQFHFHRLIIISPRMRKIKLLSSNPDLSLEISNLLIKFLIMSTILFFKMTSTPKDTPSGSSTGLQMLKKEWKSSSTWWTWSNLRVCIMKAWRFLSTLRRGRSKRLLYLILHKRRRNVLKAGTEVEKTWATSKTTTERTRTSRQTSKDATILSHLLILLSTMMTKFTLPIPNHIHTQISQKIFARYNQSNLTTSQEILFVEPSPATSVSIWPSQTEFRMRSTKRKRELLLQQEFILERATRPSWWRVSLTFW